MGSLENAREAAGVKTVRLSHGRTAYRVQGETGPWVVLVNGLLTPMYAWEPLASSLADAGFRVLSYDLFGRGLSDRPTLTYELGLFTRQLVELTQALDISFADYVGWSMGSVICSQLSLEHPDRVRSHVLIAPGLFVDPPLVYRLVSKLPFASKIIASLAPVVTEVLPTQHMVYSSRFPRYRSRMREQLRYPGVAASFASTVTNYPFGAGPEFRPAGAHPRPVLVLWGDRDSGTLYSNASRVREIFPRAELLTFRGARHAPHLDHAEEANAAIVSFLQRDTRAGRPCQSQGRSHSHERSAARPSRSDARFVAEP
jgi:pimeloyl-ACP methyl ester carboxylesterase